MYREFFKNLETGGIESTEKPYPMLNLTQHRATPEQAAAGVYEVLETSRPRLIELLTFETLPTEAEVVARAEALATEFQVREGWYLIGGCPYLMGHLERAIDAMRGRSFYAFSVRKSVETPGPNGVVTKASVFKHAGFFQVGGWWNRHTS